jgi:hypothetical protein
VTTRAENIGLRFDYENEIQFQFHLEIVPSRGEGSQQIENEGPKWEWLGEGRRVSLKVPNIQVLALEPKL